MLFWDVSKMLKCTLVVIGTLFKGYKNVSYNIPQMLFLPQNNVISMFIFIILRILKYPSFLSRLERYL